MTSQRNATIYLLLLLQQRAGLPELVEQRNILRGIPTHAVRIIAHPYQQGAEQDGVVEAVAPLTLQYQGRRDQDLRLGR